jgi:putative polyketide hydroxylase
MMTHEQIPVLIVGGGLIGLSASLFLAHQGVSSLLVERHTGTYDLPRARGFHFRTMELFRQIGLEDEIMAAGASTVVPGRFLTGETLASARRAIVDQPIATGAYSVSPSGLSLCPQDRLEPLLLQAVRERSGHLRLGTELISFTQDPARVIATVVERASGAQHTLHADYLIAADGVHSSIRTALGIPMSGRGVLAHYLNIYFHADLRAAVGERTFSRCEIMNPEVRGQFLALEDPHRWVFHALYSPEDGETPEDFSPEHCVDLLHKAIGIPTIEIEIKKVTPWDAAVRVADCYQQGRVFLAGDAAHQVPPWGGYGGNTSIGDAHNLAWKLAAVLQNQATQELLSTYQAERQPVAHLAAEQAGQRSDVLLREGIAAEYALETSGSFKSLGAVTSGYHYHSLAIIQEDQETPRTAASANRLEFTGKPGTRAPHGWIEQHRQRTSTLDLFEHGFVLLTGEKGSAWCEAAREVATRLQINLRAYRLGPDADLRDPENAWLSNAGIETDGALLVRPDGVVAWRSRTGVQTPQQVLEHVLACVLGRTQ